MTENIRNWYLIDLILLIIGSKTPSFRLFLIFPFNKSKPQYFNCLNFSSSDVWDLECATLSLETSSAASCAALDAKIIGIIAKASANSAIANCSFDPYYRISYESND